MNPIQTIFKGYKFRSRLEARWAVFFDTFSLGASSLGPDNFEWDYEPQGFYLSDGRWYLPDFYYRAPDKGVSAWYEVKANESSDDGKLSCFDKDIATYEYGQRQMDDFQCTVLSGDPWSFLGGDPWKKMCPRCGVIHPDSIWDYGNFVCSPCDATTLSGGDLPKEIGATFTWIYPRKGVINCMDLDMHKEIVKLACDRARQARFEHGESP